MVYPPTLSLLQFLLPSQLAPLFSGIGALEIAFCNLAQFVVATLVGVTLNDFTLPPLFGIEHDIPSQEELLFARLSGLYKLTWVFVHVTFLYTGFLRSVFMQALNISWLKGWSRN